MTRRDEEDPTVPDRGERELAELLAEAGPREEPPREDVAAALSAARFAWERRIRERTAQPEAREGAREDRARRSGAEASAGRGDDAEAHRAQELEAQAPGARDRRKTVGRPAPTADQDRTRRAPVPGRRVVVAALAIAAALLLAVGLRLRDSFEEPLMAPSIATVEVAVGVVELLDDGRWRSLAEGSPVPAGAELRTGAQGRAALRTVFGTSLRADRATRWSLAAAERIELSAGSVYLDSGEVEGVVVATAIGEARDVGTRFLVGVGGEDMTVAVRDGAVVVDRGDDRFRVEAGIQLTVPHEGEPQRRQISPHGDLWSWTTEVAPPFELEGSTLADFLAWLETETGWTIAYDESSVGEPAESIVLHGSLDGVSPLEAPAIVLPGAEVSWRLEDGVLVVE